MTYKVAYPLWFGFFFAGEAAIFPFINVYFEAKGLTKDQIGLIGALRPWLGVPASFLWAALADHLGAHRFIMLATFVAFNLCRFALVFASSFAGFLANILLVALLEAPVTCLADAAVMAGCRNEGDYGRYRLWGAVGWGSMSTISGWVNDHYSFGGAFVLNLLCALPAFMAGWYLHPSQTPAPDKAQQQGLMVTASTKQELALATWHDTTSGTGVSKQPATATATHLTSEQQPNSDIDPASGLPLANVQGASGQTYKSGPLLAVKDESEQLLPVSNALHGGSEGVGWGFMREQSPQPHARSSTGQNSPEDAEYGTASCQVSAKHEAFDGKATALPEEERRRRGQALAPEALSFGIKLQMLLTNPDILVFCLQAIVMGIGFGMIESFLFLFLGDLGASDMFMGFTLAITCAAETVAFQLQGMLLTRLGVEWLLNLCLCAYIVRMFCYSLLTNFYAVLPVEILHGITFAFGWGAGTVNCKRLAPCGLEATMQGIFQGLYFGFGYGVGTLLGGHLSERYGYRQMYLAGSSIVLCGWATSAVARMGLQILRRPHCNLGPRRAYLQLPTSEA